MEPRLNDLWPAAIDTVLKDEVVCSQSLVAVDESPSPAPELETLADPDAPRPTPPITDHKHAATSPDSVQSASRNSCGSSSPVVLVVSQEELSKMPTRQSEEASNNLPSASKPAVKSLPLLSKPRAAALVLVPMVYSEYGELVEEHTLRQPSKSEDLTVTQLLRIIKVRHLVLDNKNIIEANNLLEGLPSSRRSRTSFSQIPLQATMLTLLSFGPSLAVSSFHRVIVKILSLSTSSFPRIALRRGTSKLVHQHQKPQRSPV